MAKRRGSGEGTIYERKDGRWCAQVSFGYKDGKPHRKLLYGKTRLDVSEALKKVLRPADRIQRRSGAPDPGNVSATWLEQTVSRRTGPRPSFL